MPHCWEVFELLAAGGVALKIETDGSHIDEPLPSAWRGSASSACRSRWTARRAATHERVRPGSSFDAATAAIRRLAARGLAPQLVFVPTRLNIREIDRDLRPRGRAGLQRVRHRAADADRPRRGRLGRHRLHAKTSGRPPSTRCARTRKRATRATALSIYPWDILTEMEQRLASPQAMLLVVPNGKVKLLNALPFAPADLRRDSLEQAWQAYRAAWRSSEVREFIAACRRDSALLGTRTKPGPSPGRRAPRFSRFPRRAAAIPEGGARRA